MRALYIQSSGGIKNSNSCARKVKTSRVRKKIICFRSQQKHLQDEPNPPPVQSVPAHQARAHESSAPSRLEDLMETLHRLRMYKPSYLVEGQPASSKNSDRVLV